MMVYHYGKRFPLKRYGVLWWVDGGGGGGQNAKFYHYEIIECFLMFSPGFESDINKDS